MGTKTIYKKTNPCNDCPYRLSSPLQKWSIEEFEKLLRAEASTLGSVFGCHKKDGHVCRGWLFDQVRRGEPSITLRMDFAKHKIPIAYRDSVTCKGGAYESVEAMCLANYPELADLIQELKLQNRFPDEI